MFKLLILALVAGAIQVNGAPASNGALIHIKQSIGQLQSFIGLQLPGIYDHNVRAKRQADFDDSDDLYDDSTSCLLRCSIQMKEASQQFQSSNSMNFYNPQQAMNKPNLDITQLNTVCAALRPSVQCFDRCPASTTKSALAPSLDPIRYICIDRFQDIQNNYRCMQKLEPTVRQQCQPKCRRYESAANRTMAMAGRPYLNYFRSVDEIREMLAGTCQYIECWTDCQAELTRIVCGQTAGELVTTIVQKLFASLKNVVEVSSVDNVLPQECIRLANPNRQPQPQDAPPQRILGRMRESASSMNSQAQFVRDNAPTPEETIPTEDDSDEE